MLMLLMLVLYAAYEVSGGFEGSGVVDAFDTKQDAIQALGSAAANVSSKTCKYDKYLSKTCKGTS